jgi:hypothetical protein
MLLFQYGVYNWGDEFGRHFGFDLTRQFIKLPEYEPYQLSFALIYPPEPFEGIGLYDTWSDQYGGTERFITHIKSTDGFKAAEKNVPMTYRLMFNQC